MSQQSWEENIYLNQNENDPNNKNLDKRLPAPKLFTKEILECEENVEEIVD
jgi:hypothetical protein